MHNIKSYMYIHCIYFRQFSNIKRDVEEIKKKVFQLKAKRYYNLSSILKMNTSDLFSFYKNAPVKVLYLKSKQQK